MLMRYSPEQLPSGFRLAWRAYPKKVGKGAAMKAWHQNTCEDQAGKIVAAIKDAKWSEEVQYIPHMSTWLNRWGWLDEAPEDQDNENW
jgi:hypothetical protein